MPQLAEPFWMEPLETDPWWMEPGRGHYRLYRGQDRPEKIDWTEPVGFAPAGVTEIDVSGLGHAPGVDYYYGLRAVSDAGVEETNTAVICRVLIDEEGALVTLPPNGLSAAWAEILAAGKVAVNFEYDATGELSEATAVEIAEVTALGIDWETLLASESINGSCRRRVTLEQSWGDGQTVHLATRAATADGTGGPVTYLAPVVADAAGPEVARGLAAEVV